MTEDTTKVPVDALKAHYYAIKEKLINESEVLESVGDITPIFFTGLRQKLIKGEVIAIVISGQTTKGKSSGALFIKKIINEMIVDLELKTSYKGEEQEFELCSANQIEYLRIARREDLYNVCTLIDEFSQMARTGMDATVESSYLTWYEQTCAQKFLHRIFCNVGKDYDNYANIHLEVIDTDKPKRITILKVYYTDYGQNSLRTCIGTITLELEDMFEKPWYIKYRQKKFFALDLLLKNQIRDLRELEFAVVKLIAYKKLQRLAEMGDADRNLTLNKVKEATREIGGVHSIIGELALEGETRGLLQLLATRYKKIEELNKPKAKPLTQTEILKLNEQIKIYDEEIEKEIQNGKTLIKLYIEYMSIGNDYFKNRMQEILKKYDLEVTL